MAVAPDPRTGTPPQKKRSQREWAPRMWIGMELFGWSRLLVRNRFAVNWRYWHVAVIITLVSVMNLLLRAVQWVIFGLFVRRVKFDPPPVFILGHWRSGTTLLHELLATDQRHGYPTTYACLAPNHFLISEEFALHWLRFLAPPRRPMDNMAFGFERAQEDEFAMANLGALSPYLTVAFPNRGFQFDEYLTLDDVPPRDKQRWMRSLAWFLRRVAFRMPGRLIVKSPAHTARVATLLEMFPDARFVHIVRDPRVVYASTCNLWKQLYAKHGLQKPTNAGIEDHVLQTFERMYAAFERDRALIPAGRLVEIRYEDLVKNTEAELESLYARLELGDFEPVRPAVRQYLASTDGYQTNRYDLSPERQAQVDLRWGPLMKRYGYDAPAASP